jgi:hypothetical protein
MTDEPLFDLFSFGRRGRGDRLVLSVGEMAQISRTVGRAPEVVVKVLPGARAAWERSRRTLAILVARGA